MMGLLVILVISLIALPAQAEALSASTQDLFSATFSKIRKHHYVNSDYAFFIVTNLSQQDIDDVVLSLALIDSNNEVLTRTAVNVVTPGIIWLHAGESTQLGVPLDSHPDAKALMLSSPESARLEIKIRSITFTDSKAVNN